MLEAVSGPQHREEKVLAEPGGLAEVRRINLELGRPKGPEFEGRSSREDEFQKSA